MDVTPNAPLHALFLGVTDTNRESWICGFQTSVDPKTWRKEISNIAAASSDRRCKKSRSDDFRQAESRVK